MSMGLKLKTVGRLTVNRSMHSRRHKQENIFKINHRLREVVDDKTEIVDVLHELEKVTVLSVKEETLKLIRQIRKPWLTEQRLYLIEESRKYQIKDPTNYNE